MGSNVEPELTLAPIRSLDEFLLSSARFQWPDNFDRRVHNNLLYYQTNYFILAIIVFVLFGITNHPNLWLGLMALSVALMTKVYANRDSTLLFNWVPLILISIGCYILADCIFVLLFLIFFHASLRKRNMRNKISNTLEEIGVTKTPLRSLLNLLRECVIGPQLNAILFVIFNPGFVWHSFRNKCIKYRK